MRLFCFGFGYSAEALAHRLSARTSRSPAPAPASPEASRRWAPGSPSSRATPPRRRCAPAGRHHACAGQHPARPRGRRRAAPFPRRPGSAAGPGLGRLPVDGRRLWRLAGAVGRRDEPDAADVRAQPATRAGRARLARASAARRGRRVEIFRLAGIYGPGRSVIDNLRAGTARRIVKPGQVFNRIHVDDIARVLAAAIDKADRPQHLQRERRRAGAAAGRGRLCRRAAGPARAAGVPFEQAGLAAWRPASGRRASGSATRASRRDLGVELLYPTYREGLRALAAAP